MRIENDSQYHSIVGKSLASVALVVYIAACGGGGASADVPRVIATTSILADVVAQVGGDAIQVDALIPRGVDPHDFAPSAQQVASLSSAELIVANGLELEIGLEDVLEQARSEGLPLLEVAPELDPLAHEEEEHEGEEHEEEAGHEHGAFDPHFWQDPRRMATATSLIAAALIDEVGLDAEETNARAASYATEIESAYERAEGMLTAVPAEWRLLVTNHEAFAYFADAYGFEVLGTIIPGGSTLGEPSSEELADLIALLQETGVPAIFTENIGSNDLANTLAAEVGREVRVVELVSDSLAPEGADPDTYLELIEFNARAVAGALGQG
jgi:zinc/manganese transport system substrate-binding protein